jgi:hypothetical protein
MDAQVIPGTPTVSLPAARGRGIGGSFARFQRAARSPTGTRARAGARAREHDGALTFALGRAASARRAADDIPAAVAVRDPRVGAWVVVVVLATREENEARPDDDARCPATLLRGFDRHEGST